MARKCLKQLGLDNRLNWPIALCENGFTMEVMTKVNDEVLKKYKEKGGYMQIKVLADSLHPPHIHISF